MTTIRHALGLVAGTLALVGCVDSGDTVAGRPSPFGTSAPPATQPVAASRPPSPPPPPVPAVAPAPAPAPVVRILPVMAPIAPAPRYPLHRDVTATMFWVGEPAAAGSPSNAGSAWDEHWLRHFGGRDDPRHRRGYRPAGFVPHLNPFYVALPFNDFQRGHRRADAMDVIPWAAERSWAGNQSMCKGRWLRLTRDGRTAYARWEDVGPFVTNDAAYVFGTARPRNRANQGAGIDVSPAVRDYLLLGGMGRVDWQFVDAADVPPGPWRGWGGR